MNEDCKFFSEIDPFNNNFVTGYIYTDEHRYGDLLIKKVNDKKVEQYIHTTPKIYYPGDVDSMYKIKFDDETVDYEHFFIFEKIDGTNICRFTYMDENGKEFVSYKTRLTPFLKDTKHEKYNSLWNKILFKYPDIADLDNKFSYGFELFGNINKHLIKYDVELDAKILYKISKDGEIDLPPFDNMIQTPKHAYFILCIVINKNGEPLAKNEGDYYFSLINDIDNIKISGITRVGGIEIIYKMYSEKARLQYEKDKGSEGYVFYIVKGGKVIKVWKCKPEIVIKSGMDKNSGIQYIGDSDIETTCINSLESLNDLTLENLLTETKNLLLESYSMLQLELSNNKIEEIVKRIYEESSLKKKVFDEYEILKNEGLSFKDNKKEVLSKLSSKFNKKDMNFVFKVLNVYYL